MIDDGFKIEFLQMQTSYFSPHGLFTCNQSLLKCNMTIALL